MNEYNVPEVLSFERPFRVVMYPTDGPTTGDFVFGTAAWRIAMLPNPEQNMFHLKFEAIDARLDPGSAFHFDVDGDGRLERISLDELAFSPETFDLERSGGVFDPSNGHVTFEIVIRIDPTQLPDLQGLREMDMLEFHLVERGRFDIANRIYKSSAAHYTVREGPFAGLTVMNCVDGEEPCDASLCMGVILTNGNPASMPTTAGQARKEVWKKARTPIKLLWESTNSGVWKVEITPILGQRGQNDSQDIPDPFASQAQLQNPLTNSTAFNGRTVGGDCREARDSVIVNIYEKGMEVKQSADYEPEKNYYIARLPDHCYDKKLKMQEIYLDLTRTGSVTHRDFRYDHTYGSSLPSGGHISQVNDWEPLAAPTTLPGTYIFTPQGNLRPGDEQLKVFFRLRIPK